MMLSWWHKEKELPYQQLNYYRLVYKIIRVD